MSNREITPQQAACLLNARNAMLVCQWQEAWHWLYRAADFNCESQEPWSQLELIADKDIIIQPLEIERVCNLAKEELAKVLPNFKLTRKEG